jgi:hypothetical protein
LAADEDRAQEARGSMRSSLAFGSLRAPPFRAALAGLLVRGFASWR